MSREEEEHFLQHSNSFESPLRNVRSLSCPDTAITEYSEYRRNQYLENKLSQFKQSQNQLFALQISKLQKKARTHYHVGLGVLFALLVVLFCHIHAQLQRVNFRAKELQHKHTQLISEIIELQRSLQQQNHQIQILLASNQKIKEEIIDLHMNELMKEERSMHVLQKYSNVFKFEVDHQISYLNQNFNIQKQGKGSEIRKKTDQELMFFATQSIPMGGIYYFKVKIIETLYGMIGIGIIPAHKRQQKCVYCDSKEIYYIYCKNGKIYQGQMLLSMIKQSKTSRYNKVKVGDTVTVFVDNKQKKVIWYVNSRYAGSQILIESVKDWHPFIEMTSRGDIVKIIE